MKEEGRKEGREGWSTAGGQCLELSTKLLLDSYLSYCAWKDAKTDRQTD